MADLRDPALFVFLGLAVFLVMGVSSVAGRLRDIADELRAIKGKMK